MSPVDDSRLRAAADAVGEATTDLFEVIYGSLVSIGDALIELWARLQADGTPPRSTDLESLRGSVVGELASRGPLFNGAGVVMADGSLTDRQHYLEWWRADGGNLPNSQRLVLDLNPRSEYYYDYSDMEWFSIPRDRNEKCVYGPYLDYTGVDLYVCTFAVPVRLGDGTFLGIAGADVPVASIESRLWPQLRRAETGLVLVNANGRVIVGNDPEYITGSKVPSAARSGEAVPVRATPWSLVPLGTAG
ncbi:cache domain-containing protein [Rhodococcus sp. NPDC056960]|uniref:cache domain-containing protein n=1 Tax=Rhodococcus sp. NPDC056960 TaxID=3345982 RepID=UPI00363E3ACD